MFEYSLTFTKQQTIFEKKNHKKKILKDAISWLSLTPHKDAVDEFCVPKLRVTYLHHYLINTYICIWIQDSFYHYHSVWNICRDICRHVMEKDKMKQSLR